MTTHWMPSSDVCRSFERVCSATLTIVVSSTDMIAPRITTIAIRQTWGSIREVGEVMSVPLVPERFGTESLATKCFGFKSITLSPIGRF